MVGLYFDPGDPVGHGFVDSDGAFTKFPDFRPEGINDAGQILMRDLMGARSLLLHAEIPWNLFHYAFSASPS